jgi:hypothetical protein
MDYDLWVKFAKLAEIKYTPQLWAKFRIHGEGKTTVSDDRCWPEMRKIYQREGGGLFSVFMTKYLIRMSLGPAWNWYKMKRLRLT